MLIFVVTVAAHVLDECLSGIYVDEPHIDYTFVLIESLSVHLQSLTLNAHIESLHLVSTE